MANRMKEVARLFGVKLEEVFYIEYYCPEYVKTYLKFTEMGLMHSAEKVHWDYTAGALWRGLITGDFKITKAPWKPKAGETYYIPAVDSESGYYAVCCENSDEDERRYRKGLVFRTRGKAIALTQKMLTVAKENG